MITLDSIWQSIIIRFYEINNHILFTRRLENGKAFLACSIGKHLRPKILFRAFSSSETDQTEANKYTRAFMHNRSIPKSGKNRNMILVANSLNQDCFSTLEDDLYTLFCDSVATNYYRENYIATPNIDKLDVFREENKQSIDNRLLPKLDTIASILREQFQDTFRDVGLDWHNITKHNVIQCLTLLIAIAVSQLQYNGNPSKELTHAMEELKHNIERYLTSIQGYKTDPLALRLATLEQLKTAGHSTKDVAELLVANDYALYGDLGECEGDPATWQSFMECYPQTFRFLVDGQNKIVGNWSLLAPSDEHIRLIESGNIQESLFRPSDTEFLLSPRQDPYVGFLLNFSVNVGFQTPQNIKLLFDAFCEQLLSWAQFGIYFSKFYVNCFRGDHGKMFESFGFIKKIQNNPHGTIYLLDLTHLPTFGYWSSNETLVRTYHDYFFSIM